MSRVKRLLTRALLVAGGALAGTAAAWALATAPATAEVVAHEDAVAAVTQVVADRPSVREPVRETVAPVRETVHLLDATLHAHRAGDAAPPQLGQVAEGIRGAVGEMGAWFEQRSNLPARADAPTGRSVAVQRTEPAPTATAVPVSVGTPVVRGAFGKLSETWAHASAQPLRVSSDEPHGSQPGAPAGPLAPFAPPSGVPAHCACGGDGAGSAGGNSGPFTGVFAEGVDSATARALLPATERNTVMPGKQPGITPD
ncbi:hypothetical protein ACQPZF_41830 [Actinosynnema sp. CS-041913]|uniref:hypothetical protein n=1 Tax=Actinosynnema sp. CS-041913 TaxID=3239917 RepID=UPI003D8D39EB